MLAVLIHDIDRYEALGELDDCTDVLKNNTAVNTAQDLDGIDIQPISTRFQDVSYDETDDFIKEHANKNIYCCHY